MNKLASEIYRQLPKTLCEIFHNTGFFWPVFSRKRTKSVHIGKIQVRKPPYSRIFYAVSISYISRSQVHYYSVKDKKSINIFYVFCRLGSYEKKWDFSLWKNKLDSYKNWFRTNYYVRLLQWQYFFRWKTWKIAFLKT